MEDVGMDGWMDGYCVSRWMENIVIVSLQFCVMNHYYDIGE